MGCPLGLGVTGLTVKKKNKATVQNNKEYHALGADHVRNIRVRANQMYKMMQENRHIDANDIRRSTKCNRSVINVDADTLR